MSSQRRSASRRPSAGASAARRAAGAVAAPAEETTPSEPTARSDARSDAAVRAARAEERRVRVEEPVQRSGLAERAGRLKGIYQDTRAEVKKIAWPDRDTTRNLTIVVIGISIVLGIVLGGIDFVLFQIFEALP